MVLTNLEKFLKMLHQSLKDFKGNLMKRKTLMVPWHLMVQDETLMGPGWLSPPDDGPGGVEQRDDGYSRRWHWWSDRST